MVLDLECKYDEQIEVGVKFHATTELRQMSKQGKYVTVEAISNINN